jgi:hypothetical protein
MTAPSIRLKVSSLCDNDLERILDFLDSSSLLTASGASRRLRALAVPMHDMSLEREMRNRDLASVERRLNTLAYVDALEDGDELGELDDSLPPRAREVDRQAAFNAGFRASFSLAHRLSRWRGFLSALRVQMPDFSGEIPDDVEVANPAAASAPIAASASDMTAAIDPLRVDACIARIDAILLQMLRPHASGLAAIAAPARVSARFLEARYDNDAASTVLEEVLTGLPASSTRVDSVGLEAEISAILLSIGVSGIHALRI